MTANLLEPLPDIGSFDVIFLRNMLIYFDMETKTDIVRRDLVAKIVEAYDSAGSSTQGAA